METITVHQALHCLQTTKEGWCRMHTLIGESNQWWNLSPLQMLVLKLGLLKPFSCVAPSVRARERWICLFKCTCLLELLSLIHI